MTSPPDHSRYSRQIRFAPIGEQGQVNLERTRVLVCGCGALGSQIAERLARAGVGSLRLVDRDWVEKSNLQRQALFTEADAAEARPKAIAAAERLRELNADISVEGIVDDVTFQNIASLAHQCDLILDGTDNFETRFLINDYCIKNRVPWIHGGCLGASGQILSILPGESACFRCLVPDLPPRDALQTCDSAGVLGPTVGLIACWQASEALKVLSGNPQAVCPGLIVLDSWNNECRILSLQRRESCPTCGQHEFPFLDGSLRTETTILCGKNAVQLESPNLQPQSLETLAERLASIGEVRRNAYFVRAQVDGFQITIFQGGRTVVEGTTSAAEAKTLLARTLGS